MDKYYEDVIRAIRENNIPEMIRLVPNYLFRVFPEKGYRLLRVAYEKNLTQIVEHLINKDCVVVTTNKSEEYQSPLYYAIINGNKEIVEKLLIRGDRVNMCCDKHNTLLLNAIENAEETILELLIHYGFDEHEFIGSCTPLHLAALWGKTKVVEKFLEKDAAAVDVKTPIGMTPIHFASYRGHLGIVERLINKGASMNELANCNLKENSILDFRYNNEEKQADSCSPLHIAIENGHLNLVKLLLDHGANVNAQYKDGETALYLASKNSCEMTKLLLSYCPHVNDSGNKRALTNAILNKFDLNTVRCLFEYGFTIDPEYVKNKTFLIAVCELGCVEAMKNLIRHGLDVNIEVNSLGDSLLHLAVKNKKRDLCELLLNSKASVNIKNHENKGPIFYSVGIGDFDITKLLFECGAERTVNVTEGFNSAIAKQASEILEFITKSHEITIINLADGLERNRLHFTVRKSNEYVRPLGKSDSDDFAWAKIAKLMLAEGYKVNSMMGSLTGEFSTLINAAVCGYKNVVQVLLEQKADPNYQAKCGTTALHVVVALCRTEMMRCFIDSYRLDNLTNCQPSSFDIAAEKKYSEIVELLLKYGSDCNLLDKSGVTALHYAVFLANQEIIKLLLKSSCNISLQGHLGQNALHIACKNDFDENFRLLLKYILSLQDGSTQISVDLLNLKDMNGLTPLMIASLNGCQKIVEILLDSGVDVNSQDSYGRTALHHAVVNDFVGIIELLIKYGIDCDLRDARRRNALHLAVEEGNEKVIEMLVKAGCDYKLQDFTGRTIFHTACERKNMGNLRVILICVCSHDEHSYQNYRALLDKKNTWGVCTSILASEFGSDDKVDISLHFGASANCKTFSGRTAFRTVITNEHVQIVELLLKLRIDWNIPDGRGRLPLHLVVTGGSLKVIGTLLNARSYYELKNVNGRPDLYLTGENSRGNNFSFLLKYIGSVNDLSNAKFLNFLDLKDNKGLTPLMIASKYGCVRIVENLLYSGVNVNSEDIEGHTALHHAALNKHCDTVRLLLKFGADINRIAKDGCTPLTFICQYESCGKNVTNNSMRPNVSNECLNILENHVTKLMVAELYISGRNVNHMVECYFKKDQLLRVRNQKVAISCKDCLKELNISKTCFLHKTISFYDIITVSADRFAKYLKNEELLKSLNSCDIANLFPIYADVIFGRFKLAEKRKHLKERCRRQLGSVNSNLSRLPYTCIEEILSSLNDDDLRIFSAATGDLVK